MTSRTSSHRETFSLAQQVKDQARDVGFDDVGIVQPDKVEPILSRAGVGLDRFLQAGWQGEMGWLDHRKYQRRDPRLLWPDVRSVVMLGMNYGPAKDPMALLDHPDHGVISVYAQGKDYHDIVKKRLKELARWFVAQTGANVKVFVDTAPVMEKPLAEAAGLGWQGKHTNLVSRSAGSWLFLGAMFTTIALQSDNPGEDACGTCRRCLDICPTDAFPAPYQLDARRCISYLTIEHKGPIPTEFRKSIGNRIYGCDDCLAVCPWNKFASQAQESGFYARAELGAPHLADLAALDDASFRGIFSGSPIKRTGRDRFVRNVAIALGNSGDKRLVRALWPLKDDQSPLVRGAAIWALSQLMDSQAFRDLKARHLPDEVDAYVRSEWSGVADG